MVFMVIWLLCGFYGYMAFRGSGFYGYLGYVALIGVVAIYGYVAFEGIWVLGVLGYMVF